MTPPIRGAVIAALLPLAACMAPMTQREAQDIAHTRLVKYCKDRCGTVRYAKAQKIAKRWLVDFDSPLRTYTVTVEDNGSARVSVWNKQ